MILHAGPIQILYDRGFLRYLKYGDSEVLRMIYFALRDENWTTYQPIIENEHLDIQPDQFNITYDCFHEEDGQRIYSWKARLRGYSNGTIEFEINGLALKEILRNRAGFCILHPIHGLAGQPCSIHHPDGSTEQLQFPFHIEPRDPFKLIQRMQWKIDGRAFNLDFEGDLFETEDQRNWSDASYKTFCTPLTIPFPVLLKPGDMVYQKVVFKPVEQLSILTPKKDKIVIQPIDQKLYSPLIGIGASESLDFQRDLVFSSIKNLQLDHYRVDIFLKNPDWKIKLLNENRKALLLHTPMYLVLHLNETYKEQLDDLIQWKKEQSIQPSSILLLSEGKPVTLAAVVQNLLPLRSVFPKTPIGAGTNFGFTEVNRNRFDPSGLDFIAFSVNPQMHASDDLTIIENIETQEEMIRSAKVIFGESNAIHISPLTLRMRFNPNATNPQKKRASGNVQSDPRQLSPFAAAFTLGSLKALSIGGCASVTLFETAGPLGIVSETGKTYPVYDALQLWKQVSSGLFHSISSHPLLVDSLFSQKESLKTLTLINYTDEPQKAYIENTSFELNPLQIKTINL